MPSPLQGTFGGSQVVIDPAKLAEFLRSPNGPIIRAMIENGQRVKTEAQGLVGVYKPPDAWSAANRARRPGTLRDSIVTRLVSDPQSGVGVAVLVGSEDAIALLHHEGVPPHPIRPSAAPRLAFFSRRHGHVIQLAVGRSVDHPGSKRNPYLVNALRAVRWP